MPRPGIYCGAIRKTSGGPHPTAPDQSWRRCPGGQGYLATVDCHLLALDARTGKVVWDPTVEDYNGVLPDTRAAGAKGKVVVGTSGGELGIRGFVAAYDAQTGKEAWKTYTIPGPGEPGHDTWPGETWKTGGVSAWSTGNYDPQLNLMYWGTGNAAPWTGDMHTGDNLYATSVLALDADTGTSKATISITGMTRGTGMRSRLPCLSMYSVMGVPSRAW